MTDERIAARVAARTGVRASLAQLCVTGFLMFDGAKPESLQARFQLAY